MGERQAVLRGLQLSWFVLGLTWLCRRERQLVDCAVGAFFMVSLALSCSGEELIVKYLVCDIHCCFAVRVVAGGSERYSEGLVRKASWSRRNRFDQGCPWLQCGCGALCLPWRVSYYLFYGFV